MGWRQRVTRHDIAILPVYMQAAYSSLFRANRLVGDFFVWWFSKKSTLFRQHAKFTDRLTLPSICCIYFCWCRFGLLAKFTYKHLRNYTLWADINLIPYRTSLRIRSCLRASWQCWVSLVNIATAWETMSILYLHFSNNISLMLNTFINAVCVNYHINCW